MKGKKIPHDLQVWIDARKRFRLSHAQIQMARELGMNPRKFGGLANHDQEPWKSPLPQFIEQLYRDRFGKERPEHIVSIEEKAQQAAARKAERRKAKAAHAEFKAGVAWYKADQWDRLCEIAADKDALEETYSEWVKVAENGCAELSKAGVAFEKVVVDVDELEAWCRERGVPVDGANRSHFVSEFLRLKYR